MPIINYRFISIEEECERESGTASSMAAPPPSAAAVPMSRHTWLRRESGTEYRSTDPTCFALLDQFYTSLMIPTFPLDEERDDIHDWMTNFRKQIVQRRQQQKQRQQQQQLEGIVSTRNYESTESEEELQGGKEKLEVVIMIEVDNDASITNDDKKTKDNDDDDDDDYDDGKYIYKQSNNTNPLLFNDTTHYNIIGAVTMEYYQTSQIGLLGYIVVNENHRGYGLGKVLHQEALLRIEMLANKYGNSIATTTTADGEEGGGCGSSSSTDRRHPSLPLRAIFAETNSVTAGDITVAECRARHEILYNLGYRLIHFPYAQPPLDINNVNASFDDMMLLVYFPYHDDDNEVSSYNDGVDEDDERNGMKSKSNRELMMRQYCPWYFDDEINSGDYSTSTVRMKIDVPWNYVDDFYQTTFIYHSDSDTTTDNEEEEESSINDDDGREMVSLSSSLDYRTANYYKLAHWYTHHRQQQEYDLYNNKGLVEISLLRPSIAPWEDIKESLLPEFEQWKQRHIPQDK